MPLYEYQCEKCGDTFELIQKFGDEPLTTHEKCGGPVHRLISAPALQFKGSGWYVTDYAKSGSNSGSNPGAHKKDHAEPAKPSSDSATPAATPAASTTSSTPAPASSSDKK